HRHRLVNTPALFFVTDLNFERLLGCKRVPNRRSLGSDNLLHVHRNGSAVGQCRGIVIVISSRGVPEFLALESASDLPSLNAIEGIRRPCRKCQDANMIACNYLAPIFRRNFAGPEGLVPAPFVPSAAVMVTDSKAILLTARSAGRAIR